MKYTRLSILGVTLTSLFMPWFVDLTIERDVIRIFDVGWGGFLFFVLAAIGILITVLGEIEENIHFKKVGIGILFFSSFVLVGGEVAFAATGDVSTRIEGIPSEYSLSYGPIVYGASLGGYAAMVFGYSTTDIQ